MPTNLTQQRLEQAFAASGLTQAELARASGIDRGSISLYLSGRYRPKADKLLRLAGALGVSVEWLTGVDSAPTEPAIPFPVATGLDSRGDLAFSGETLLIPRPTLGDERPEGFFVLEVRGLAMYPRLLVGDRLLVKRTDALPEGATAVLAREGALLVRQFRDGTLHCANPEYPPHPLDDAFRVLGQAITLVRGL